MAKTRNLPLLYIPKEYRMLDLESLGHDFVKDINVGGTNSKSFIFFFMHKSLGVAKHRKTKIIPTINYFLFQILEFSMILNNY